MRGFELSRYVIAHDSWIIFLKHTLITIAKGTFKLLVKRLEVELVLRLVRPTVKHGPPEHQLTFLVEQLVAKLLVVGLLLLIIIVFVLELACDKLAYLRQVPDFILRQRQRRIILEFLLVPLDLGIILCLLCSVHSPLLLIEPQFVFLVQLFAQECLRQEELCIILQSYLQILVTSIIASID